MNRVLQDLLDLLNLERIEDNLYRGQSRDLGGKSVFGGQVIGQALVAAARTVTTGEPHSLHAYFLRPGDMNLPIVYEVDHSRDGRTFTSRRVQAIQHGQPILSMMASFQTPEPGLEHQVPMPDVPPPEKLLSQQELVEQWSQGPNALSERQRDILGRVVAIEFKPTAPVHPRLQHARPPQQAIWFRAAGRLPDDPLLHRCVMAYASDFNLLSTALLPHGKSWLGGELVLASIDHAIWFHRDVRVDDWLLYAMDSPSSQGGRGLSRAGIYDRQGRLVASVAQENLMREATAN